VPARRPGGPEPASRPAPRRAAPATTAGRGVARRRFLAVLAMLALIAAIVAIAFVALSDGGGAVQLRRVVADDAQQAVEQLRSLIDDNTK
jgi:hypothetical protein